MEGITDAMRQYERSTEQILKNRPKHQKAYGIKRPESMNIVAILGALFVVFVIVAQIIQRNDGKRKNLSDSGSLGGYRNRLVVAAETVSSGTIYSFLTN